ncbi:sugar phosphate isomerase/epimerase [Neobacillus niacini]|uniref:sugar phosphate isomerase/epimerase n=1 Tax=Neobacillus niacini TaxID=86668 RepID=UPI003B02E096
MRRLQIGMWHRFDQSLWERYSHPSITGLEVSQFNSKEDYILLNKFATKQNLKIGIHAPTYSNHDYPLLSSANKHERENAILDLERQIVDSTIVNAEYILFHYPFPPIFPKAKNKMLWEAPKDYPYFEYSDYSKEQLRDYSCYLFENLIKFQNKYKQRIVLEYDFFGEFQEVYVEMFKKYPEIGLVLDTQRMDYHKRAFPGFNPCSLIDEIHQSVYLLHYSNTYYGNKVKRHLPVLPFHQKNDFYGDSITYLKYLAKKNNSFHVTFEHNPSLVSLDELERCYTYVSELLNLDNN